MSRSDGTVARMEMTGSYVINYYEMFPSKDFIVVQTIRDLASNAGILYML